MWWLHDRKTRFRPTDHGCAIGIEVAQIRVARAQRPVPGVESRHHEEDQEAQAES
jgi:hypothetical protein